jgi:hypothetical protein
VTTIIGGLERPVRGERVLAVSPELAVQVDDATWRRRPNFYPGRAVTPQALNAAQAERAGRIATGGQALAPGVVSGLEVTFDEDAEGQRLLQVSTGLGLTASGEDVRLTRPLRVVLDELELTGPGAAQTVRELREAGAPFALIVFLQPVIVNRVSGQDPRDPCELDPADFAFDDPTLVDAVRLGVTKFPLALPAVSTTWRNELVYALFQSESGLPVHELLPWEGTGLGVALVGFPGAGGDPFLDVHGVARDGGHANHRRVSLQQPGTRRLWQARFRQFMQQLGELALDPVQAATLRSAGLRSAFRYLPPVGTLPAGTIDVRGDRGEPHLPLPPSSLFPPSFVLEAVPIELEALDDTLATGASLAAFDLDQADQVQVLVPLPAQYFDPDVLLVEDETPDEFRAAIRLFLLRLNHRLGRRFGVRDSEASLSQNLFGNEPVHPNQDLEAVLGEVDEDFPGDEDLPPDEVPAREEPFGADLTEASTAVILRMIALTGIVPLLTLHDIISAENGKPLEPAGILGAENLAQRFINTQWGGHGSSGFVESVSRKLVRAAESLDMAFVRIRSELYRVRAGIAGESAATQLATSPALSAVIPRPSGAPTQVQLESYKRFLLKLDQPDELVQKPARALLSAEVPSQGIPGADGVSAALLFNSDIVQRLHSPLIVDAQESTSRAKRLAFRKLLEIHRSGLSLSGLKFPGFRVPSASERPDTAATPWENPTAPPPDAQLDYRSISIEWIAFLLEKDFDVSNVWRHDPILEKSVPPAVGLALDEAGLFATAIRATEQTIAALRMGEAQLAGFEKAVAIARDRVAIDVATWNRLQARLQDLEEQIHEFRQDVRIARALEQEEIARAQRVNVERRQLLAEHVPFLVFRRPRTVDGLVPVPTAPLAPARIADPIPAALQGNFEAPEQVRLMVDLLRDAPLAWLVLSQSLLEQINRLAALWQVVQVAHVRGTQAALRVYNPFEGQSFDDDTGEKIRDVYRSQQATIASLGETRLRFDYYYYLRFSWWGLIPELAQLATINDLLLTNHGRQDVTTRAAAHLNDIYRVAACVYDRLRRVPPFARLEWLEVLKQAPGAVDLRQLAVLPDWVSVAPRDRLELQALVDWLYRQVRPENSAALQFMHDLLRVVILLSSHPPVNQILLADARAPRPVSEGGSVEFSLDAKRVRIGMLALLYESRGVAAPVGRGLVEDLSDGVVAVRVLGTQERRSILPVRAELIEPDSVPGVSLATGDRASLSFSAE